MITHSPSVPPHPEPEPHLGLALSGGGFRAAFFHVGVLARLAERGVLRHVRVISCVSGGSMFGTLYYLKLRERSQQRQENLTDVDYVDLVEDVGRTLRESVRHNLRARMFLNPVKNLEMLARANYARSDRVGDLLDHLFYRATWGKTGKRYLGLDKQIPMQEIAFAQPDGTPGPELILNATCLNTGHRWSFIASGMGEPAVGAAYAPFDRNASLERADFVDMTEAQSDFPLALAVAASGAFPGLVSPLSITGLYRDYRVRLVDGGAHDNQGIEALNNQLLTGLIVSDAAAQMPDEAIPHAGLPAVLARINSIYGDRVREEQLVRIGGASETIRVLHLRQGLGREIKRFIRRNPEETPEDSTEPPSEPIDGIAQVAQKSLASIRTDLDCFSDLEAYSLMLDGYLTADSAQPAATAEHAVPDHWEFARVQTRLAAPSPSDQRKLDAGHERFAKTFCQLSTAMKIVGLLGMLTALAVTLWACYQTVADVIYTIRFWRALGVAGALAVAMPVVGHAGGFPALLLARAKPSALTVTIARWTPIALVISTSAALAILIRWGQRPTDDWLSLHWKWGGYAISAELAFFGLPVLLVAFSGAMWLDGRAHLWLGRVPQPVPTTTSEALTS